MNESQLQIKLLSYRNGYFQGQTRGNQRHGNGIMLLDDGVVLLARWKNDVLYGSAFAFINSQQYAYLNFNRGQLQEYCVFMSTIETLAVKFNNGRPIDTQILINRSQKKAKILTFRNGSYQTLQTVPIDSNNEAQISQKYFGLKLQPPPILQFIQKQFCNNHQNLQIKTLSNNQSFIKYNDISNPLSIGFMIQKGTQINSYGLYLNEKLHGFGCKFQKNAKYQGQFQHGHLNGLGMRLSNNRYSFGRFQAGELVQPLFLQERSPKSLQKLHQLRKKNHIQSLNFYNAYIPKDILRFRGIAQITTHSPPFKDFLYTQAPAKPFTTSNLKGSNVSLNQLLSSKVQANDKQGDNKSIYYGSQVSRGRNLQDHNALEGYWTSREGLQPGSRFA